MELKAGLTMLSIRNLHFTREKARQRAQLIVKPWKRGGGTPRKKDEGRIKKWNSGSFRQ